MNKRIITINRMYGSGGRVIGKALAEKLGYAFYDKELIELAGKEKQIPFSDLARVDEKSPANGVFPAITTSRSLLIFMVPMNDILVHPDTQKDIILSLAEKGSCVIVGRCANHILQGRCLSVYIHVPFLYLRVRNVQARTGRERKRRP